MWHPYSTEKSRSKCRLHNLFICECLIDKNPLTQNLHSCWSQQVWAVSRFGTRHYSSLQACWILSPEPKASHVWDGRWDVAISDCRTGCREEAGSRCTSAWSSISCFFLLKITIICTRCRTFQHYNYFVRNRAVCKSFGPSLSHISSLRDVTCKWTDKFFQSMLST